MVIVTGLELFIADSGKKQDLDCGIDKYGNRAFFFTRNHILITDRLDQEATDAMPGCFPWQDNMTYFRIIDSEGNQTEDAGWLCLNMIEGWQD